MSSDSERIDGLNYTAVSETLVHHGKCLGELTQQLQSLGTQVVALRQELEQQRGLIVRSLQQKYGNGPTER